MATTTVTIGEKEFVLPGDGFDAFEQYVYHTPSQPEICSLLHQDIIDAYEEAISKKAKAKAKPLVRKGSVTIIEDDETWDANYAALKAFHAKNGNCAVPFGKDTGALRSWTERQKKLYASSNLESGRVDKMKALEFDFTVKKPLSTRAVAASSNGTAPRNTASKSSMSVGKPTASSATKKNKPAPAQKLEPSLSFKKRKKDYNDLIQEKQAVKMAAEEKARKEEEEKKAKAKAKPMVRKPSVVIIDDDETWNKQYNELKAFHAKNGNCDVPFGKETGALRSWAERQKKLKAGSKLDTDRLDKLKELNFAF